jgi:O-antigen/teichoic acid export membrane protein
LRVFLRRGRPVYLIQASQAVIGSMDLLIVGVMSGSSDMGLYSAPHRMVTAVLTFGLIFQQVVFPSLARSWRETPEESRRALDLLVRVVMLAFIPIAIGTTVLAEPLVRFLFKPSFADASLLLAIGVWRAPLLMLAFLYQTTLIALNRESAGVRLLLGGALISGPIVALFRLGFGLPGACAAVVMIALALAAAGYGRLRCEGRHPSWHHHLARPLIASLAMVVACLLLREIHVVAAAAGGAVVYLVVLTCIGGLRPSELKRLMRRT